MTPLVPLDGPLTDFENVISLDRDFYYRLTGLTG